jgi:hypothetical protein
VGFIKGVSKKKSRPTKGAALFAKKEKPVAPPSTFDIGKYAKKSTHRESLTKEQVEAKGASRASASAKKQPKGGSRSEAAKKGWETRKGGKSASSGGGGGEMHGFKPGGSKAGLK